MFALRKKGSKTKKRMKEEENRGVFRIGFRDSGNPSKKKKKNNREAARAAAGSRQDTKSNVEDLSVHSAGMARSCVMSHDAAGHRYPSSPPYMPTRACLCCHGFNAEFFY